MNAHTENGEQWGISATAYVPLEDANNCIDTLSSDFDSVPQALILCSTGTRNFKGPFCNIVPTYNDLPREIRENRYAQDRNLCELLCNTDALFFAFAHGSYSLGKTRKAPTRFCMAPEYQTMQSHIPADKRSAHALVSTACLKHGLSMDDWSRSGNFYFPVKGVRRVASEPKHIALFPPAVYYQEGLRRPWIVPMDEHLYEIMNMPARLRQLGAAPNEPPRMDDLISADPLGVIVAASWYNEGVSEALKAENKKLYKVAAVLPRPSMVVLDTGGEGTSLHGFVNSNNAWSRFSEFPYNKLDARMQQFETECMSGKGMFSSTDDFPFQLDHGLSAFVLRSPTGDKPLYADVVGLSKTANFEESFAWFFATQQVVAVVKSNNDMVYGRYSAYGMHNMQVVCTTPVLQGGGKRLFMRPACNDEETERTRLFLEGLSRDECGVEVTRKDDSPVLTFKYRDVEHHVIVGILDTWEGKPEHTGALKLLTKFDNIYGEDVYGPKSVLALGKTEQGRPALFTGFSPNAAEDSEEAILCREAFATIYNAMHAGAIVPCLVPAEYCGRSQERISVKRTRQKSVESLAAASVVPAVYVNTTLG